MKDILGALKRRLGRAGRARWPAIGQATGLSPITLRKIYYGDHDNPQLSTVQALLDYFREVNAGRIELPPKPPRKVYTRARPYNIKRKGVTQEGAS